MERKSPGFYAADPDGLQRALGPSGVRRANGKKKSRPRHGQLYDFLNAMTSPGSNRTPKCLIRTSAGGPSLPPVLLIRQGGFRSFGCPKPRRPPHGHTASAPRVSLFQPAAVSGAQPSRPAFRQAVPLRSLRCVVPGAPVSASMPKHLRFRRCVTVSAFAPVRQAFVARRERRALPVRSTGAGFDGRCPPRFTPLLEPGSSLRAPGFRLLRAVCASMPKHLRVRRPAPCRRVVCASAPSRSDRCKQRPLHRTDHLRTAPASPLSAPSRRPEGRLSGSDRAGRRIGSAGPFGPLRADLMQPRDSVASRNSALRHYTQYIAGGRRCQDAARGN